MTNIPRWTCGRCQSSKRVLVDRTYPVQPAKCFICGDVVPAAKRVSPLFRLPEEQRDSTRAVSLRALVEGWMQASDAYKDFENRDNPTGLSVPKINGSTRYVVPPKPKNRVTPKPINKEDKWW